MDYNILMEEEKLGRVLNELEIKINDMLDSMDSFNKLWNSIYESYKNNNFEVSEAFNSLIISIYNDWKDKSSIVQEIEESLNYIVHELKATKKSKTLSRGIIAGINQEVQSFSSSVKKFEVDKNAIDYLTKECRKNKQRENLPAKSISLRSFYSKRLGLGTITSVFLFLGLYRAMHNGTSYYTYTYLIERSGLAIASVIPYNYGSKKVKFWIFDYNLSKLSQSSIEMNTKLRDFGLLVSTEIGRVDISTSKNKEETNHYSSAFDIEIDGLIKITQRLHDCFKRIQERISQNESNARYLVLKCNPRFLITN